MKEIIEILQNYIEKTEYWKYEDGLVLGSDEAQTILSALEERESMKRAINLLLDSIEYMEKKESSTYIISKPDIIELKDSLK